MNSSLDYALTLWRFGLSVIPVPRPRPGATPGTPGDGKVPTIAWKEFQSRRPTEREIREWFQVEQNLAVITGSVSGAVVVDADSPAAVLWIRNHLPRTQWQTQTGKGFHLWYRHPGGEIRNKSRIYTKEGRLEIDIRGDRGFVIAPGSLHANGKRYLFAGDWSVPKSKIPFFWRGWIERPSQPIQRPRSARPAGDVVDRARRYLKSIPKPELGNGSDRDTLYAAARLVRGFNLPDADAVSLLWEWAGDREGWTREWIERKVRNALEYCNEPIGGLR